MTDSSQRRVTGAALIAGATLVQIPYALLISRFHYPQVLRHPTSEVLTQFHAGGPSLVLTWLAFAWSGAPLLLALPMLPRALGLERDARVRAATAVGFAGLVVQIVGLLRWVFVVPVLARTYVGSSDAAARSAAGVAFELVHAYGGVAIGEHLGMALTCAWMATLSVALLLQDPASRRVSRWLGALGLAAAIVYSLAQGELLGLVVAGFPSWGPAGLIGSLLWLGWMAALGVGLLRTRAVAAQPRSLAAAGALAAMLLVVTTPTPAEAQTPPRAEAHFAPRVRPTVALGAGLALVGLDSYGIALSVRAGVDVVFRESPTHSLAVTLGWTPYTMRGARLDLIVLDAGWRWRPSTSLGLYTLLSVGVAAARESLDVTLGAQRIDEASVYIGGAASVGVGWTLFEHVDIEVTYRQALLAMGTADGPGSIGGSVGGRL